MEIFLLNLIIESFELRKAGFCVRQAGVKEDPISPKRKLGSNVFS